VRRDVPVDLERVILRCLEKNPDDRFQDVTTLEQALADCESADKWTEEDARAWWQDIGKGKTDR
jgi:serine/threonine-protein kinase